MILSKYEKNKGNNKLSYLTTLTHQKLQIQWQMHVFNLLGGCDHHGQHTSFRQVIQETEQHKQQYYYSWLPDFNAVQVAI